jgi:hypothetical protein
MPSSRRELAMSRAAHWVWQASVVAAVLSGFAIIAAFLENDEAPRPNFKVIDLAAERARRAGVKQNGR